MAYMREVNLARFVLLMKLYCKMLIQLDVLPKERNIFSDNLFVSHTKLP